jgi:hypothetical protein
MPSFDCSCNAIRVLVARSVSKSGGLVHAKNKYNTESVFVLEHAGTPKPAVNAACQAVAYHEESLLSCVNWMDENANCVHRAHNQLNWKCPCMSNTRCIALRN